jgi:hypothetical protein
MCSLDVQNANFSSPQHLVIAEQMIMYLKIPQTGIHAILVLL